MCLSVSLNTLGITKCRNEHMESRSTRRHIFWPYRYCIVAMSWQEGQWKTGQQKYWISVKSQRTFAIDQPLGPGLLELLVDESSNSAKRTVQEYSLARTTTQIVICANSESLGQNNFYDLIDCGVADLNEDRILREWTAHPGRVSR